jgi:transposase
MYLRHTTRKKDGKTHVYWQLVRSVRHGRKVVQETVAQLGELDAQGRANARALARSIAGEAATSQRPLFEADGSIDAVPVKLGQVRLERSRAFGAVWLGWLLWQALKLDELCRELLPPGRESVGWADVVAILVIGRLCEPSSELHVAEQWYRTTALEDLLQVPAESVYDERLYRTLDRLLPHKEAIEQHLVKRFGELFDLDYELLLYDVTSTYFEGQCAAASIARRGYSRDHRPDCVQVNIALVVTRDGMPLGYEIFPGNTVDVTTVEEIVSTMERRFGKANRVWVMDRGMMSAENIAWLQQTGRRYVIGTPRSELKRWSRQLADKTDWRRIREDVEVKICRGPEGRESFLLCRSAARTEKEHAMHERFSAHIEAGLESMARRIAKSKRALDRGVLERQIGRLLQRNARAAARYSISIEDDDTCDSGLRLKWTTHPQWDEWANHSEGTYILRSNVHDWSDEELWKTYIQLTEAEAAFRIHKSDLAIRPIWHQKAERIQAHILVCFLGYAMWKTLQQWQSRAGLGDSPRTILTELSRITAADVVLPLADGSARELRIRCIVRPDRSQALLIDRLGITLPQRLRPSQSVEM